MPVACQLMKPLCLLIGTETHICLGISPLGPPAPNPREICISVGIIDMPVGDNPSVSVSAHTGRLIKLGHDSKFLRPHFSTGLPPLPSAVPPPLDLGLIAIVIAFGQAKSLWGPYSIKAEFGEAANPAVIFLAPGLCLGAANFSVCSEIMPGMNVRGVQIVPNTFNVQVPSTVFAGMTMADVIGNIVAAIADAVLAKLLENVFKYVPGLKQLKKLVDKMVEKVLGLALKPVVRLLTSKLTEEGLKKAVNRLENVVGMEVSAEFEKKLEKKIEEITEKRLEEGVENAAEKAVDKSIETVAAPLTEKGVEVSSDAAKEKTEEVFGEEGEGKEGEGEGKEGEGEGKEGKGEGKGEGEGKEGEGNQSIEPPNVSSSGPGPKSE